MSDAFTVGAEARIISASPAEQATVTNAGGSTVYYKKTSDVGVSSNDGSLTRGESLTLTASKWFITAPTGSSKLFVEHTPDEQTDPATQAELNAKIEERFSGTTLKEGSLPSPVVLDSKAGPAFGNPLIEGADLLIGSNVVPTPAQIAAVAGSTGGKVWAAQFWNDLAEGGKSSTTWEWVKKQIDALVTTTTEGRAIRIIGATGGIGQGYYTRAEYVAAWKIVSDYCHEQGLLLYPALSPSWHNFGPADFSEGQFPDAADLEDLAQVALSLSRFGTVVGFDVVQEYNGNYPEGKSETNAITSLKEICAAIRATGCQTPLTASRPVFASGGWEASAAKKEAEFLDFIDKHVWYGLTEEKYELVPNANDPATIYSEIPSHIPIVFGEAGIAVAASEAQQKAYYEALEKLLKGSRVAGCFQWAIADQTEEAKNKFGLFSGKPSESLTARTAFTGFYKTWPRRRQATGITKYLTEDKTTAVEAELTGLTGEINQGGLGATNGVTIPYGMDGLFLVSISMAVWGGSEAGEVDFFAFKAGTSTKLVGHGRPFAKEEHLTLSNTKLLYLVGGEEVRLKIAPTKSVTAKGGESLKHKSFISLLRVGPAVF